MLVSINLCVKWKSVCCLVLQCDVCRKTFVRPCLLRNHIRLVHPADGTVEVYSCTEYGCSRTYASIRSLRRHVALIHEGQTAECPQCSRILSTKVSINWPCAFCLCRYKVTVSGNIMTFIFGVVNTMQDIVV